MNVIFKKEKHTMENNLRNYVNLTDELLNSNKLTS